MKMDWHNATDPMHLVIRAVYNHLTGPFAVTHASNENVHYFYERLFFWA